MPESRSIFNLFSDFAGIWQEFKFSWGMFPDIYFSGFLIALILSISGIFIIARNQIFIGAAITQVSTFGIAIALTIIGLEGMSDATGQARQELILRYSIISATICTIWAFVDKDLFKAILTKLKLTTGGSREINNAGQEKITGWLFLLASAGTIVLVSNTPLGIEEIKKISFSSIIGADKNDVKLLIFLLIIQLILIIPFINTLLLVFTDRNYALTRGIPATFIEFVFAIVMGIILGTTLKISGSLYSFGALILPPLIAINLTNKTKLIFILSPIIALVGAFLGFSLGSFYNIPQPQLTIFIFALFFPIALLYKSLFLRK